MPVHKRKLKSGKWEVVDVEGKVHAKGTSKKNATAQERILNMIAHGIEPKGGWKKRKS